MIEYFKGAYTYILAETVEYQTVILDRAHIVSGVTLDAAGLLTISRGYAWDGPSGPTFDTLSFMRGSLIHDALYQLLRCPDSPATGNDHTILRHRADLILHDICVEDGMWKWRAAWVLRGVRAGGGPSAAVKVRKVYTAP